jgi:diguanylate cyclase (GGDEF)-like protein
MLDVTARKEAENAVHQLAYYDILTGLPNRTLLLDRLDRALAQAERDDRHVALFFLDLDKFKDINDCFGHAFGDLLLKAVGQRLNSVIRKNDTMARFGGDEFIILLPAVTQVGEIKLVAEKVVAAMSQPFFLEGERVKISTSVGIAMSPLDGKDAGTLLKRADTAMYIAKDQGRDGYCFFDGSI